MFLHTLDICILFDFLFCIVELIYVVHILGIHAPKDISTYGPKGIRTLDFGIKSPARYRTTL